MPLYKVTFVKRFDAQGEEADRPETFVEAPDGIVLNASRAEVIEPDGVHNEEALEEDDSFLSIGSEVWEYEIAEGRDQEFISALELSRKVLQYEQVDEVI